MSNVKGLDDQSLTQIVGTLLYKNKHVSSCLITGSNLWNAGWQNLPDLFQIQNGNNLMVSMFYNNQKSFYACISYVSHEM